MHIGNFFRLLEARFATDIGLMICCCRCRCCATNSQVHAPAAKRKLLQLLDLPAEQLALLTADAAESRLHVGPMASPDPAKLAAAHLKPGARWKRVVAFRPTGAHKARQAGAAPHAPQPPW